MFDTRSSEMQADHRGKQPIVPIGSIIRCNQKESKEVWKRPTSDWAKLNFDAGFSENWGVGSWGAVLRNDRGEVLLSAWGLIQHVATSEAAEALAGMYALQSALPHYAGPQQTESDRAALILELKSENKSKSTISGIVEDIKNLSGAIPEVLFLKVNRSGNMVPHELAKLGRNVESMLLMIGHVPSSMLDLTNSECNKNSYD
jgi:hypothetical protein